MEEEEEKKLKPIRRESQEIKLRKTALKYNIKEEKKCSNKKILNTTTVGVRQTFTHKHHRYDRRAADDDLTELSFSVWHRVESPIPPKR